MADDAARWLAAFVARRRGERPDLSDIRTDGWEPEALEAARFVWRRRVVNEQLSVSVAERLREASDRLGDPDPGIDAALLRLAEDERTHVEVAAGVLEGIGAAGPSEAEEIPLPIGEPAEAFLKLVLTGLCVCETVSASRFAAVRRHTDLATFRACIELFHRDELAHAELGFVLLPGALARLQASAGSAGADAIAGAELRGTFGHLDRVVGLDLERRGGPPPARPQPPDNPGVVEPAVDAEAFYGAIHAEVLPRLEALGIRANEAWERR